MLAQSVGGSCDNASSANAKLLSKHCLGDGVGVLAMCIQFDSWFVLSVNQSGWSFSGLLDVLHRSPPQGRMG